MIYNKGQCEASCHLLAYKHFTSIFSTIYIALVPKRVKCLTVNGDYKEVGVYHLLLMCHAAVKVRIKYLAALSLLYYFMKLHDVRTGFIRTKTKSYHLIQTVMSNTTRTHTINSQDNNKNTML